MKTPEEIKKALECHVTYRKCADECPYENSGNLVTHDCIQNMVKDAYAYIQKLEERIDMMMLQIRGDCGVCKNRDLFDGTCEPCQNHPFVYHPLWEYEGFIWERTDDHEKPV